jgi:hypothetical protein
MCTGGLAGLFRGRQEGFVAPSAVQRCQGDGRDGVTVSRLLAGENVCLDSRDFPACCYHGRSSPITRCKASCILASLGKYPLYVGPSKSHFKAKQFDNPRLCTDIELRIMRVRVTFYPCFRSEDVCIEQGHSCDGDIQVLIFAWLYCSMLTRLRFCIASLNFVLMTLTNLAIHDYIKKAN